MPASVRTLADGHETWRFDAKRDGARRRREESRVADTPFLLTNDRRSRFSARLVHASRRSPSWDARRVVPRARSLARRRASLGGSCRSSSPSALPRASKIFPQKSESTERRRQDSTILPHGGTWVFRGRPHAAGSFRTSRVWVFSCAAWRSSGLTSWATTTFSAPPRHKLERLTIRVDLRGNVSRDVPRRTAPRVAREIRPTARR